MKCLQFSLLILLIGFATAFAQTVPSGMTYQGRLTDASGAPVPDGTGYEIEVRLWNSSTGGSLLWGTRYTGVPLKNGAFNLILGSGGTPIAGAMSTDLKAAFNNANVHLGLTTTMNATGASITSPNEVLPRQQIFSSPYAFRAEMTAAVQTDGVLSSAIKDGEVKTTDMADAAITASKFAAGAVNSQAIGNAAVLPSHLAPGITADKLDIEYAKFVDEKPTGTNGGAVVFGWQKRILNTTVQSQGTSITRNGDVVTLQPGTYWIQAYVPQYHGHQIAFLKDSADNILIRGRFGYGDYQNDGVSEIRGIVTVSGQAKDVQLWAYNINAGGSGQTLGRAANVPGMPEQYSELIIFRIK